MELRAALAKVRRHKHKRPPRELLRGKRRHVVAQGRAVEQEIKLAITTPGTGAVAKPVAQLRATLKHLRNDVLHEGAGTHTHVVASALQDLDRSLAKLLAANEATDPKTAMESLAAGKQALDDAKSKARKAGHDWPL